MSQHTERGGKRRDLEIVSATLEHYDPHRLTVVIGTAALVLQGIRLPYRVPDVDVLAPIEFIKDLKGRMHHDRIGDSSWHKQTTAKDYDFHSRDRIMLEPDPNSPLSLNLLPFQAFTDLSDDKYKIHYHAALDLAHSSSKTGHSVLPPDEILHWKARIGRKKDKEFIDKIVLRGDK